MRLALETMKYLEISQSMCRQMKRYSSSSFSSTTWLR